MSAPHDETKGTIRDALPEPAGAAPAPSPSPEPDRAAEPAAKEHVPPTPAEPARPEHAPGIAGVLPWLRQAARRGAVVLAVIAAFVVGYLAAGSRGGPGAGHEHGTSSPAKAQVYTCSMHPQIRQPGPGKCPICGMDLIPATSGGAGGSGHPRELTLDPGARKLAEIETTKVLRQRAAAEVRAVGKVAYDERRMGYLTAWVAGRIERLYVTFTGVTVKRWQPMVELYSPELVTAQMELLQALRMQRELSSAKVGGLGGAAEATLQAAREKLRLLGLSAAQLQQIEQRGKPVDQLTIYAPLGGVVIEKSAQPQMYVKPGTRLYTIADLRRVWVKLDVYESELAWVKKGQEITFTTEAWPGQSFTGTVDFVDPFVSNRTRTVKVRLTVDNKDGRLKPDMFVRAVLTSPVGAAGQPVAKGGKQPGAEPPLLIPASAPLLTGTRAVVYLEVQPGTYRGQEVKLGPRVGKHYVVLEGLKEGDRVVTRGAFKIDSALQIQARPSMMSPEDATGSAGDGATLRPVKRLPAPPAFRAELSALVRAYYPLQHALSRDDLPGAKGAAKALATTLAAMKAHGLGAEARAAWDAITPPLTKAIRGVEGAADIHTARRDFEGVSDQLIEAVRRFGLDGQTAAIRFRCTMAFDNRGANWIQAKPGVENPYFGSQMFRCGDQHESLAAPASERSALTSSPAFQEALGKVLRASYAIHHGLSRDALKPAQAGAKDLLAALKAAPGATLGAPAKAAWAALSETLGEKAEQIAAAADLGSAREAFAPLSEALITAVARFGVRGGVPLLHYHCSMAFANKGASWLQGTKGVENPYYGAQMFRCGEERPAPGAEGGPK